ncbi:MAG: hypothetical protein IPK59_14575 [Rhodospirillaceae bacterium]|nr:hypothetical protein [Rhodospirillaceae bacterium]
MRASARARASQPVPKPDPTADLQCLFKAYDAAWFDFDADAVAGFYDLPCLLSSLGGNASFTARGELRAAMARLFTHYRQRGLVSASIVDLKLRILAGDFARGAALVAQQCARHGDHGLCQPLYAAPRRQTLAHRPCRVVG